MRLNSGVTGDNRHDKLIRSVDWGAMRSSLAAGDNRHDNDPLIRGYPNGGAEVYRVCVGRASFVFSG